MANIIIVVIYFSFVLKAYLPLATRVSNIPSKPITAPITQQYVSYYKL